MATTLTVHHLNVQDLRIKKYKPPKACYILIIGKIIPRENIIMLIYRQYSLHGALQTEVNLSTCSIEVYISIEWLCNWE